MPDINKIADNADVIIDGIAFNVTNDTELKRILACDLYNPNFKASFIVRGQELTLSVSSFHEQTREKALIDAVKINSRLLMDEVYNA